MIAAHLESHRLHDATAIPSPSLLVYPRRIQTNLQRMIKQIGDPKRLRPHIKTTKMKEVVGMMLNAGITKLKCATLAEAELCALAGAPDVLLAYQPVGPHVDRLARLILARKETRFSTLADCVETVHALDRIASQSGWILPVYLDLDCGMGRSGIAPGPAAEEVYQTIAKAPSLELAGFHVYDGHIRDSDPAEREQHCQRDLQPVWAWRQRLLQQGLSVPHVIMGGTPTFPIHARDPKVECSPGTCVLWDAGYAHLFPDMPFEFAALVLTRVVSKPGPNRLCLDLGHKAIASEMPHPRVVFPALPDAAAVGHSEEHLVVETAHAPAFKVGDVLYGLPWHICPTVALHDEAFVVEEGRVVDSWRVAARGRRITI